MAVVALLGVLPSVLHGADAEGLYETEVRVAGQGAAERQEALRTALAEVMVKVTGQRNVSATPALADTFKRADRFIQQYRYRPLAESRLGLVPLPPAPPVPAPVVRKPGVPAPPAGLPQTLWVSFDAAAVNKVLRQAGLPLWGRSRPVALVMLAVEEPSNRYILLAENDAGLQAILETRAWWRGLPVRLPQRSEADGGVRFLEVWNNSQEPLLRAAAHERADVVLAGRMTQRGNAWRVRWTLFQANEEPAQWEIAGDLRLDVLEAGIDGAADVLGKRFAQLLSDTASNIVLMTVIDIATLDNYARAMRYLQSLDEVAEVGVVRMEANSVTFRVAARSTTASLTRAIALGKKFAPIVSSVIEDPLAADAPQVTTEVVAPAPPAVPVAPSLLKATELRYQLLQ